MQRKTWAVWHCGLKREGPFDVSVRGRRRYVAEYFLVELDTFRTKRITFVVKLNAFNVKLGPSLNKANDFQITLNIFQIKTDFFCIKLDWVNIFLGQRLAPVPDVSEYK